MKKIGFFLSVVLLAGCATQERTTTSTDPSQMYIGEEKPEGFPRDRIVRAKFACTHVHEDWIKDEIDGETIWFRNDHEKTVNCPES